MAKFEDTDRYGHQALGYFYTSKKYPWPRVNGIPYRPLIQISLDKLDEQLNCDFGGGLVQLFECMHDGLEPDEWYLVRHIPQKCVSEKYLTNFPSYTEEKKTKISEHYIADGFFDELFGAKAECINIENFNQKIFQVSTESHEELSLRIGELFLRG